MMNMHDDICLFMSYFMTFYDFMVENLVAKPGKHELGESRTTSGLIRRSIKRRKKPNGKLETTERKIGHILGAIG